MILQSKIQEIVERADLFDIVKTYAPDLKETRGRGWCCCPFHHEKTPSFSVNTKTNRYICFGCGKRGDAIQFVREMDSLNFAEAVKKVAGYAGVPVEDLDEPETAEERENRLTREAKISMLNELAEFFAAQLWDDNSEARVAREYCRGREWDDKYLREAGIGYVGAGNKTLAFARERMFNLDHMVEMGVIGVKDGRYYDSYRNRIVIPLRSRSNNVVGFSCRLIKEDDPKEGRRPAPKYINSKGNDPDNGITTNVFDKSSFVYGLDIARKEAKTTGVIYLVEGAVDAMRLHSFGAYNAVACCGSAWTDSHFQTLKSLNVKLCFIPDMDARTENERYGHGVETVMQAGKRAIMLGCRVSVKEMPQADISKKVDADSYIKRRSTLESIDEKDFISWYSEKIAAGETENIEQKDDILKKIAPLIAYVDDKTRRNAYISAMPKHIAPKSVWKEEVAKCRKEIIEEYKVKKDDKVDDNLYELYGFWEKDNCYWAMGKEGAYQWSNFVMKPMFHIEDNISPKRLYKIKNQARVEKIIELKQGELTSLGKFSEKVEGLGNYIWLAKQEHLNKLKMYLYDKTETAREITQLGWQTQGFWAFGNGVFHNGQWIDVDEYGIARIPGEGNYYLPATSKIYALEKKLFQFERKFVLTRISRFSLKDFTDKFIEVYGDNARVGICYLLATLFRDVVTAVTKFFPLLNLFGQPSSGKSEFGHTLMSFFIIENTPVNITSTTYASLADAVAQCSNALVHLDEYKNDIDKERIDAIKGLFDGVGRTRMNMDRDKKRETTAVDCGVILSGQEMPTIDIAIFTRVLYLTFDSSHFSIESKQKFNELQQMRKTGCSHLTLEILKHRDLVESEFPSNYRSALGDLINAFGRSEIDDRIIRSWAIPLGVYRTLSGVLDISLEYKELLKLFIRLIQRQQSEKQTNNEIAQFWNALDIMHQQGRAILGEAFRIEYEQIVRVKRNGKAVTDEYREPRPILYLNYKLLLAAYQRFAKEQGDRTVPSSTLENYLSVSPEYIGLKKTVSFYLYGNPVEGLQEVEIGGGLKTRERTRKNAQAFVFDYTAIADKYGINLEMCSPLDDVDPKDIDTTDRKLPY